MIWPGFRYCGGVPDRTARLLVLIDLLQSHGHATTAALADHLGVSERTVRRDLVRLQDLDIPVDVRPGRSGGVRMQPGALLAPLRFTDAELVALRLGARTVAAVPDAALARAATSALGRLESVMTPRARARAHALAASLADAPQGLQPTPSDDVLEARPVDADMVLRLAEAIRARERVTLRYASPGSGETARTVDPYGLVRLQRWYLAAHCHLRGALRTFRLDRIRQLARHAERFTPPDGFDAFAAVTASLALAPWPDSVICRVWVAADLEAVRRMVPPQAVVVEPKTHGVTLTSRVPTADLERLAVHLLGLPWRLEVHEPAALRDAFRRVAKRARTLASSPRTSVAQAR